MLGIVSRMLRWRPGSSRYLAGHDLEGNRFFEYPGANDPTVTKRVVKYRKRKPLSEYSTAKLPVQWQAWLSRTRMTPPTLEELQKDFDRRQQLLENVALIEQREREQMQASYVSAVDAPSQIPADRQEDTLDSESAELQRKRQEMYKTPLAAFVPLDPAASPTSPASETTPETDGPEAWKPQPRRRRSGGG